MIMTFVRSNMTLYNYYDAGKLKDENALSVRERHQAEGLEKVPSFGDWMTYHLALFHCTGTGPALEYRDTMEFFENKSDTRKMKPFSNAPALLKRFAEVVALIAFYSVVVSKIDLYYTKDPAFGDLPFWYKNVYLVVANHHKVIIMFIAFGAQEVCMIGCGIGFKAKTEKEPEQHNTVR